MTPLSESSVSNSHSHMLTALRFGGAMEETYEQVPCERLEDCWDLSKCLHSENKLTIFPHGHRRGWASRMTDFVVQKHPELFVRAENPNMACLLLVACDSFSYKEDMFRHPNWNLGQNHFVWRPGWCHGNKEDLAFPIVVNYQKAALATAGLTDANIRMGYDIRLAYTQSRRGVYQLDNKAFLQSPLLKAQNDTMNKNNSTTTFYSNDDDDASWWKMQRAYLLTFKGGVNHWVAPFYTHRWLALQYWEDADDVLVDIACTKISNYKVPPEQYVQFLLNSTFVFCPGGNGPGSYRFGEALATGGIPILPAQMLPPFTPEVNWDNCILRVHEGRIADLPRMLRKISAEEIAFRRKRCAHLFSETMGWGPVWTETKKGTNQTVSLARIDFSGGGNVGESQHFSTAMKIWRKRIKYATEMNPLYRIR